MPDAGRRSPSPEHRLLDLRWGPDLISASGTTTWRGWRCTCGAVGSGYRFADTIEVVNEWGEHLAAALTTPARGSL